MTKYYLRLLENAEFCFVVPELYTILPTDIAVKEEYYERFYEQQSSGKSFHLKEKEKIDTEQGLFGCVEEYDPAPIQTEPSRVELLEGALLQQQLATAEAIEKRETDKVEQQLAQAEMFETILQMLEPQGGGE